MDYGILLGARLMGSCWIWCCVDVMGYCSYRGVKPLIGTVSHGVCGGAEFGKVPRGSLWNVLSLNNCPKKR